MWVILSLIFGAIELVIGLRLIFQLVGANTGSGFVAWIYGISDMLVAPFTSIFGHAAETVTGAIPHSFFEVATLIALVVYAVVGGIILRLVTIHR